VKKHTVAIPNGRIVIKQAEEVQDGPMNMFVTSDEEKLLRFAKELSIEATREYSQEADERKGHRQRVREKKRNDKNV
jgi:hypothetical protein